MESLPIKFKEEHQELYKKLDIFLHELTQLKNHRNDEHLLQTTDSLLKYVNWLLHEHFKEEEEELFPGLEQSELIDRLLIEHHDIRNKYGRLLTAYTNFNKSMDYKQELLFPAYNLIATINHHAAREDRELFN